MEWGESVNNHLHLNTLRIAALQNNKQTNQSNNRPKKFAPVCIPWSPVFPQYFLLLEFTMVPDTAGPHIWMLSLFYYFITRTQDGTMDKGYSKAAICYISIGLFANFFLFSI